MDSSRVLGARANGYERSGLSPRDEVGSADIGSGDSSDGDLAVAAAAAGRGSHSKDGKIAEWNNMALVSALFWSAAVAGLLEASTMRSGFLWCVNFISLMLAVGGFIRLTMMGGQLSDDWQFNAFMRLSRWSETMPWILFVIGFLGMLASLLDLLYHMAGMQATAWCVFVCIICMMVPFVCFDVCLQRACRDAKKTHQAVACESDEIYAALREYFIVEKQYKIAATDRDEFVQRFSAASHGVFMEELAGKVYDDWRDKKMQSMIRIDPGF